LTSFCTLSALPLTSLSLQPFLCYKYFSKIVRTNSTVFTSSKRGASSYLSACVSSSSVFFVSSCINQSINQSIKTHLYSAICRERSNQRRIFVNFSSVPCGSLNWRSGASSVFFVLTLHFFVDLCHHVMILLLISWWLIGTHACKATCFFNYNAKHDCVIFALFFCLIAYCMNVRAVALI